MWRGKSRPCAKSTGKIPPFIPALFTRAYNLPVPHRIRRKAFWRGGAGAGVEGKRRNLNARVRERIAARKEFLAWVSTHRNARRRVKHCRPLKSVGNCVDKAARNPTGEASGRADVVRFEAIRLRA